MATIALAAPGFSSKEISFEVFNNNNHPTQILMKVTPDTFTIDGPRYGHITLELATTGGLPTLASEDIVIQLDTPNNDTIQLKNSEIIIKNGEYYAITEFEIIASGNAIIFAETEGMKKISKIVSVLEAKGPLQLQLNIFPNKFNSFSGSTGLAIVHLVDSAGDPVPAEEDIHFTLNVESPNISVNSSHSFEEILFDNNLLTIKKGEYSTFTKFTPRPNLGEFTSELSQIYNMYISAKNFLVTGDSFTVSYDQVGSLSGKGPSIPI